MAIAGYKRVSTESQNLDRQDFPCDEPFMEAISGAKKDRPELERMIKWVRKGDEVHVWSIDRLARDLRDLQDIIQTLNDKGVSVKFLSENLNFSAALLQTWGTAARRHPVGGLGSIGEMLIEHNHGFGQGRGSNSECSFNQAHLPHDTWLQAPCLGLSFA